MVLKTFYFHVFQYLQIWLNILMDDRHLNNHHKIGIKKCRFGLMFFSNNYLLFFFFFLGQNLRNFYFSCVNLSSFLKHLGTFQNFHISPQKEKKKGKKRRQIKPNPIQPKKKQTHHRAVRVYLLQVSQIQGPHKCRLVEHKVSI